MVKLGIFIHKADHVLLNSSTYKMTSLTQDRARHNKTRKSRQLLLGQTIKILYERGSITEAKYVCIGGGIMFRCQILVRDGRWVRNLR